LLHHSSKQLLLGREHGGGSVWAAREPVERQGAVWALPRALLLLVALLDSAHSDRCQYLRFAAVVVVVVVVGGFVVLPLSRRGWEMSLIFLNERLYYLLRSRHHRR